MKEGYTSGRKRAWNFHPKLPLQNAPYWAWPPQPIAALKFLIASWSPLATRLLMFLAALVIWTWFTPSLERMATFEFGWISEIWLRNHVITLLVTGGLHLWVIKYAKQGDDYRYDMRPMATNSRVFTFNDQVWDNVFWSLVAVQWWTLWECLTYWAFANGWITMITFDSSPLWFVTLFLLVPFWAGFYFYVQHRALHSPFMYKHVHSLHHRNINTGPWSGLAMHPVESFILMSDVLIFLIIPAHPLHALYLILHHGIGAPVSHIGFEKVKVGKTGVVTGDFFHQLHHRYFDCNYGYSDMPMDVWFNTFHDGTPEGDQLIRERRKALLQAQKEGA